MKCRGRCARRALNPGPVTRAGKGAVVLGVLGTICTIVGAVVLYCALMAAMWSVVMRAARRRARPRAEERAAAVALAVADPRPDGEPAPRERWATCWEELPSWLWRDRPWAVAVVLLGAPAVGDRTAPFVDFPNRVIDWAAMLDASGSWPRDQRLLVLTAYEMAFDTPGEVARAMSEPVTLQDVLRHLDDDEVERIRVAMQIRRGRLEPDEGLTRLT
jgi:hypothetical protein